jgi:3-isopropylmalate/(R)-2-methylmalate dehydratase large subunit
MTTPLTLFDKIWRNHAIHETTDGETLLYVDRTYLDESCFIAFEALASEGRRVRRPERTFVFADHLAPTRNRSAGMPDPEARASYEMVKGYVEDSGITMFDLADPSQGIMHVVAPELGLTLPGLVIVADDSHTTTHGAFGALALGIGMSECSHVLATQTLWQPRYKTMRVLLSGEMAVGVTAKDVALAVIGRLGVAGAIGQVVEFAGPSVASMTMEQRMTLCNMTVEAGGRAGLIAPDETTLQYLDSRRHAPRGQDWRDACVAWKELKSDSGAHFDAEVQIGIDDVAPMVTWGTSPQDVVSVEGTIPDPSEQKSSGRRAQAAQALAYMGLTAGTAIVGIPIDRVFIGSCTNGRIEDLRAAAAVARGGHARVPAMVVPGSGAVKRQAEAEGLHRIFRDAGFDWLDAGCSMCIGMNGDRLDAGQRCASTTNRNFVGRQGPNGRTHLMSPAMAAAAALAGRIVDVRHHQS